MILMASLKNNIKVNWIYVLEDTMLKSRRLMDYKSPYVLFISKVLAHYNVPLLSEVREAIMEAPDVKDRALKVMKLVKNARRWKAKDEVAQANVDEPLEVEAEAEAEEEVEPEEKPLFAFELSVLAKLDDIRETQRRDYIELNACFESISKRLDAMTYHTLMMTHMHRHYIVHFSLCYVFYYFNL
uniref:Uncharacterized protein n=1 Tax=Cajanus cajan TaxID=3821 RepID=A0A151QW47_CAJCA|nr:hypothetical protein KK1_044444 [Cajanus cajan]